MKIFYSHLEALTFIMKYNTHKNSTVSSETQAFFQGSGEQSTAEKLQNLCQQIKKIGTESHVLIRKYLTVVLINININHTTEYNKFFHQSS